MANTPGFFVPAVDAEDQESAYAELAKFCNCPVPPLESRIYSINYFHDGEEWTATVGRTLRGIRYRTTRSRGRATEQKQRLSDPAEVLAIFSGVPYTIVTNHQIARSVGSAWANPFYVNRPDSIIYFSSSGEDT